MSNSADFVKGQAFAYETVLNWLRDNGSEVISAEKLSQRLVYFLEHLQDDEALKRD